MQIVRERQRKFSTDIYIQNTKSTKTKNEVNASVICPLVSRQAKTYSVSNKVRNIKDYHVQSAQCLLVFILPPKETTTWLDAFLLAPVCLGGPARYTWLPDATSNDLRI